MGKRVKTLADSLIVQIETYLPNSADPFFRLAFENRDVLKENVLFDESVKGGGEYRNGRMLIGKNGLIPGKNTDGSDGDVMGTIFHEYMHYLGDKFNIYPKRYTDKEKGIVYSEVIILKETEEADSEFRERIYIKYFIYEKFIVDLNKYIDYPESYYELNGDQKKEVDEYLKNHLNKQGRDVPYTYAPSNHAKDELNAHTKTLEVSSLGLFVISFEKETYYRSEALILYERMYEKSLMIEREYGYTPEGYKF